MKVVFCRAGFPIKKTSFSLVLLVFIIISFFLGFQSPSPQIYVLGPALSLYQRESEKDKHDHPSFLTKEHLPSTISQFHSFKPWRETNLWMNQRNNTDSNGSVTFSQCKNLVAGEKRAVVDAHVFMKENVKAWRSHHHYLQATRDFGRFLRERGYIMAASEEELRFPLAFSILVYRDVEQVERLLRAIYRPHNMYCLHVDLKTDLSFKRVVRGLASCLPNVFLASKAVDVQWGTWSVLQPELICMRDLWPSKTWRYFINLTGQEFPLKTNLQLVQILSALNGSNDVDCSTYGRDDWRWYNTFAAPHGIQPRKGNVHAVLSRGFVRYVLYSPKARDFLSWLHYVDVPDEALFATLNHNPHLKVPGAYLGPPDTDPRLKPYLSRYKNWGHNWVDGQGRQNFNFPCAGKRVRTICILGVGDLPSLAVRRELFANKLHLDFEPLGLDCLEDWLWNMTRDEYAGRLRLNLSFYQHLDAVRNHVPDRVTDELEGVTR